MGVRFTMDGQEYELAPELVRSRLVGHQPEPIRQYSVDIDGVHWPVKQVLRLATGSSAFQSQTARRQLQRLGFVVLCEAMPRTTSGTAPRAATSRPAFDLNALEIVGAVDVRVAFEWHLAGPIALDHQSGRPDFPRVPALPGIYRFD